MGERERLMTKKLSYRMQPGGLSNLTFHRKNERFGNILILKVIRVLWRQAVCISPGLFTRTITIGEPPTVDLSLCCGEAVLDKNSFRQSLAD